MNISEAQQQKHTQQEQHGMRLQPGGGQLDSPLALVGYLNFH
jgi:hypothetical protein